MRLLLISPPFGEKGQRSKGLPIGPPVLEYMAGLTLKVRVDTEIILLDANKNGFDPESVDADIIGFTVLTPQSPWVYKMAKRLREYGKKVVLGGIHITALPEEAKNYADAIIVGEAENIWKELLGDAEKGKLKPAYYGEHPSLENLPKPITTLWENSYIYGYFSTSRGCSYRCTFCSVHKFFGGDIRYRPIKEVVEEVSASKKRLFWGIDDNIWGMDISRSIELYREMSLNVKRKWWFGSGDLASIQQSRSHELLDYGRKAGLTAVLVGWETNNLLSLEEYKATSKQGRDRRDAIKKIREHGIEVMLFIMVGGRKDIRIDFDVIIKLCDELNISAHPVMTTPFPGTELYDLYKPYIIPDLDWDSYDGNHAVFTHPEMGIEEREELLIRLRSELFKIPRILKRIPKISLKGFPMAHITSFMIQYPQGRAFKEYERRIKKGI